MSQYVEAINEHLQPSQNGGFNTAFEELEHNLEIAADSENFSNAEREEAVRHIEEMIKNMK